MFQQFHPSLTTMFIPDTLVCHGVMPPRAPSWLQNRNAIPTCARSSPRLEGCDLKMGDVRPFWAAALEGYPKTSHLERQPAVRI